MAKAKRKPLALGYALVFAGEPAHILATQQEALKRSWSERFAGTHAWGKCYHDEGRSAELGLYGRPEGARFMSRLQQGDLALFVSPDRAFRTTSNLHRCLNDLHRRGVRAVVLSLDLDTGDEFGARYMSLVKALGRFSHDGIMRSLQYQRTRQARRPLRLDKKFTAPYGFWWQRKKGERPRLMRDVAARRAMGLALQWSEEGRSSADIVIGLHAQGLTDRHGRRWRALNVSRSLQRERDLRQDEEGSARAAQQLERERWAAEGRARREQEQER